MKRKLKKPHRKSTNYSKEKYLTKIEINLPITRKSAKILAKIINLFTDTQGIGGCTYSTPSKPPVFKGWWHNPKKKEKVEDDIMWIYGCYDIEEAKTEAENLIKQIRKIIESEAGEKSAWITYSSVCTLRTDQ